MVPSRRERLVPTLAAVLLVAVFSGIPGEGFRQVFSYIAFGC